MKSKYDVIVVGSGPAGTTSAYLLAKAGFKVVIFERGEYPGEKNMFGGVLYGAVLNNIIPNYWEEAPLERYITRQVITFLSNQASVSVELNSTRFGQAPYNGFTILRPFFDRWYVEKAVSAGAFIVPKTVIDDLLWENGRVVGVQARRDQGELQANVVIAADGVNSLLARKAGLRKDFQPDYFGLGIKEVIQLPHQTIDERFNLSKDEGMANVFVGGLKDGVQGWGFIYTNKDSLSVGVVVQLSSIKQKGIKSYEVLEDFKSHPKVKCLVKDGVVKEYAAHLIPEGGLAMMPQLYTDGLLVVGDAAGFTLSTGISLEGANFAIASGCAAAQAVQEAASRNDFSKSALSCYRELLQESFVIKDLKTFKGRSALLKNLRMHTIYPQLVCDLVEKILTVDGHPHSKLLPLAIREARHRLSFWKFVSDGWAGIKALLW